MWSKRARHYQDIVNRFEAIAHANLGKSNDVAALREIATVNQRTLARAFHAIRGITPSRYLRLLRLSQARKTLLSSNAAAATVTQVAMQLGFRELGRFAVDYRAEFGETPSETLHRGQKADRRDACGG